MISIEMRVDTDVLDAIADAARKSPGLMNTAYLRNTRRVRTQMLTELRTDPGPVVYADNGRLRWKSQKQRRFVMRKLRAEGNLPYRRTGRLFSAFDIRLIENGNGGVLQITNSADYAPFVVGDYTQPYHLDTGYTQIADVVVKYEPILFNVLVETWFTVVDERAGVR